MNTWRSVWTVTPVNSFTQRAAAIRERLLTEIEVALQEL